MNRKSALPRWLIMVPRDRRELYSNLRQGFESDARVEVILDRRQATRRVKSVPAKAERRQPLTARERALWEKAGFRLIYRDEEMKVYQADDKPSGKKTQRPASEAGGESQGLGPRDREIRRLLLEALRLLEGGPRTP